MCKGTKGSDLVGDSSQATVLSLSNLGVQELASELNAIHWNFCALYTCSGSRVAGLQNAYYTTQYGICECTKLSRESCLSLHPPWGSEH
jgi:hypothetical protein